jgi:hypothetical protein
MIKERPILFSTPMVQAILEGRKTQTRRIINPQPIWVGDPSIPFKTFDANPKGIINCRYGNPGDRLWVRETWGCSVVKNERKGVFYPASMNADKMNADNWNRELEYDDSDWNSYKEKWFQLWEKYQDKKRPSIFMPRWASRITLEITNVKVEHIQDISEKSAKAEGVEPNCVESCEIDQNGNYFIPERNRCPACDGTICSWKDYLPDCDSGGFDSPIDSFITLWDSINEKRGYGWDANPFVWVVDFKILEVRR